MLHDIHWPEAMRIARHTGLLRRRPLAMLAVYYLLTILNAAFDGLGIVFLIELLTGHLEQSTSLLVTLPLEWLRSLGWNSANGIVAFVLILFVAKAVLYFTLLAMDGIILAQIRRRFQERGFSAVLFGKWDHLRNLRSGSSVGTLTEESQLLTRYLLSAIKIVYFLLASLVLGVIALLVDVKLTLALAAIGLPCFFVLRRLFLLQARLSKQQTVARQQFTADIAERLNSLLHIKVSGDIPAYIASGLRKQREIAHLEIVIGYYQAIVGNFNTLLVIVTLGIISGWSMITHTPIDGLLHVLAGIGILAARIATYVNGAITSLGNLSRFAGSLLPVIHLLEIPAQPEREPIHDKLTAIQIQSVQYAYNERKVLDQLSASISIGQPLALRGPSGSGKTTLANLITGLIQPAAGNVAYITEHGKSFDAQQYSIRVGYVTQDISLFHGSIRENLSTKSDTPDADLWQALQAAGAADFVHRMGGLDATIAEAGRSLSGGEKRRLGIARMLTSKPDLLILDEITTGLDAERRQEIVRLIEGLAANLVVIVITHDETEFKDWNTLAIPVTHHVEL